jgi:amino-acid N-acetyltransferase
VPDESKPDVTVRRAVPGDLTSVLALLGASGLPADGVADAFESFHVVEVDERIAAVAGLEIHDRNGVLRSVAVDPAWQGRGWGARVTAAAVRAARDAGLRRLYLLTTTAPRYFPRFGFRVIDRAAAPHAIQNSIEFRETCPDSAIAMVLDLDFTDPLDSDPETLS